jgi:hypothetical protein
LLAAHEVPVGDRGFILEHPGALLGPFVYLGAKHMVTGADHLLYLLGVIFWLYRARDVALYVTLFAVGHSLTLLAGTHAGLAIEAHLVDAVIGASVAYKAAENLGWLERWWSHPPNPRLMTLGFGLIHGLGLATRLADFSLEPASRLPNPIAFNAGVEVGQLLGLGVMLLVMTSWRRAPAFARHARGANLVLPLAGLLLAAGQLSDSLRVELT